MNQTNSSILIARIIIRKIFPTRAHFGAEDANQGRMLTLHDSAQNLHESCNHTAHDTAASFLVRLTVHGRWLSADSHRLLAIRSKFPEVARGEKKYPRMDAMLQRRHDDDDLAEHVVRHAQRHHTT